MGSLSNEARDSYAKSAPWALDVASADPSVGTIAGLRGKTPAAACLTCASRSIGVSSDFDPNDLDRFFDGASRRSVSRDCQFVLQGEPLRHVISVISGALMLSRLAAGGRFFAALTQIVQDFVSEKIIVSVTNGVRILALEQLAAPVGWAPCARRDAPPRLSPGVTNLDPSFSEAR